jgi:hypothetical protein
MLARRLTTILPEMTLAEAIETTRIHRVTGRTGRGPAVVTTRPWCAPHQPMAEAWRIGGARRPHRARGRGATTVSSAAMHAPSADGMGLQGCGNRSRRGSQAYHLPHVLDLAALTGLAARVLRPTGWRNTR